jgi:hypothetical protein
VSVPLSGLIEPGQGWRAYSACGPDTAALFHPPADEDDLGMESARDRRYRERAAVDICRSCPVRLACLVYVESIEGRTGVTDPGVWGGTTPEDRSQDDQDRPTLIPLRRTGTDDRSTPRYWSSRTVRAAEQIDTDSVRHLSRRGVPARQIADWLHMPLGTVERALRDPGSDSGVAA